MAKALLTSVILLAALEAAAADPDKLKKVATDATGLVADLEAALENAVNENAALQERIDAANTGRKLKPQFKAGKDTYDVEHAVTLDGVTYSPEQIAENPKVQKALIAGGSSAVSKVEIVTE